MSNATMKRTGKKLLDTYDMVEPGWKGRVIAGLYKGKVGDVVAVSRFSYVLDMGDNRGTIVNGWPNPVVGCDLRNVEVVFAKVCPMTEVRHGL